MNIPEWAINGVVACLCFIVGGKFPDVDLAPVFPLRHRSAWTHGLLIPLAVWYATGLHPLAWWGAVGFLPALALHLFADCWPKSWSGSALIKLYPLPFSLPGWASFLWILAGAFVSFWVWWSPLGVGDLVLGFVGRWW